jgi:hypothetical protein
MKLSRQPVKPVNGHSNGHTLPLPITRDELRRGWTSEQLEQFYRDTLSPPEYWQQVVVVWKARETELYAAMADFHESHHGLARSDLTPLALKELSAIEKDLAQVVAAKRHALELLASLD